MANDYKTPGVYVEEIPKFPPSVAGVATAIPAFIGYTDKTPDKEIIPRRISNLLEYEALFGFGPKLSVEIATITKKNGAEEIKEVVANKSIKNSEYVLYDSIRLFYDNGGGVCYIVSVGQYGKAKTTPDELKKESFLSGITALEKVDEVTLVLFPDAVNLKNDDELMAGVQTAALKHCRKKRDRFAILDVKKGITKDDIGTFRQKISNEPHELRYGAAYYPYLSTIYNKQWTLWDVKNYLGGFKAIGEENEATLNTILTIKPATSLSPEDEAEINDLAIITEEGKDKLKIGPKTEIAAAQKPMTEEDLKNKLKETNLSKENKEKYGEMLKLLVDAKAAKSDELVEKNKLRINSIIPFIDGYEEAVKALNAKATLIPPSGAIAGIYSATDQYRGVWKAPANVSIASISGLSDFITNDDQENMNIDAKSGKSVNAIRVFSGQGILVWGARTLDGNSNEWRYVSVRRLFNYIEESVQKSTLWAVFNPNDGNTWIKIKSQIENFLNNLWRIGALAGSTPDSSYYVKVGLGATMTAEEIQRGLLIVEIGLAAVRPAEFIVLRFSHKVQE